MESRILILGWGENGDKTGIKSFINLKNKIHESRKPILF